MTQDERWMVRYEEVVEFIDTNHRNPIPEQARLPVAFRDDKTTAITSDC